MREASECSTSSVDVSNLDIAIAHWHVNAWGGAEYLVTKLAEALHCDKVYTIGTPDPDDPNPYGDVEFVDVVADLSLQPVRNLQARTGRVFEYSIWEDVDWREYGSPDVVISSGATTRAVITPDDTLHINYCHSPPRWFYDLYHDRKQSMVGLLGRPLLRYLRMRDVTVDPRVDHYFANSPIVARRIRKYYNRTSTILYPPVDLDRYSDSGDEGFYLHLGRLDEEKGVPAVVDAFRGINTRLILAGGKGDISDRIMKLIQGANNIEYYGFVTERKKYNLLSCCRAVVFNGRDEDFGIVPIEANASGKACLSRNEGFPRIHIEDGINGYLHDGTSTGIQETVERFEQHGITGNPREQVSEFSLESFRERLLTHLRKWVHGHRII